VRPDTAGLELVACDQSTDLFVPPLASDDFGMILPLGNLNPPDHTIPTDHIYYMLPREGDVTRQVEVRAPGDVVILQIDSTARLKGEEERFVDYSLSFSPCRDRLLKFGHLTTISDDLLDAPYQSPDASCNEYGVGDVTYRHCSTGVRIEVDAGTVVGTAGGIADGSAALDLWAFDLAADSFAWANPQRYPSDEGMMLHVVCPLDLFTADARNAQAVRLGGHSGEPRTLKPRCGEVNQDQLGTAQGNWFTGTETTMLGPWDHHLALVHDNVDPSIGAFSIGGILSDAAVWHFTPAADGNINRDFPDVEAGGGIYCFEGLRSGHGLTLNGRILIQLVDETELLIEHQPGTCRDPLVFTTPVAYQR
jgi:hypothetical protein